LHGEADDAASELIHDDHHPVGFEDQRFTAKEIDAPEAVLGMSEESEPGRPFGPGFRRPFGVKGQRYFLFTNASPHEGGGPKNNGRTSEASTTHQVRAQASNDSIKGQ
jgi:hypothetical protein